MYVVKVQIHNKKLSKISLETSPSLSLLYSPFFIYEHLHSSNRGLHLKCQCLACMQKGDDDFPSMTDVFSITSADSCLAVGYYTYNNTNTRDLHWILNTFTAVMKLMKTIKLDLVER